MMAQSTPFIVLATALFTTALSCCSAENVYCVTPTVTSCSSCLPNSTNCTTLSEYAHEAELYFTSNTTMVFLPGDHALDTNITVANVTRLTMRGESSSGNTVAKVVCSGSVGFLFSNIERFIIHSLAFTACSRTYTIEVLDIASLIFPVPDSMQYNFYISIKYALLLQSTQYAELVNCSFHDNLGTALVVDNTNIALIENNFTHNHCESNSCVGGGGIAAIGSNLTFTGDTMFIGNEANFGGAGIFMINSTMSSTGSVHFIRNSISGNITIPGIPIFHLVAGTICASASSLHFNGTNNFINNSAQSLTVRRAGAISAVNNVSLSFSGTSNFINNSAQYEGGAICAYSNTSLSFSGTNNFINNSAQYEGGAICAYSNTSLSFSGTNNFINNSAQYEGGAICAYSNTSLSFSGTNNFINNSAQYEGGAITGYSNTSLSFSGTNNFINNSAQYEGGAICAYSNTSLSFSGTNNFINNSAQYEGGAICAYSNTSLSFSGTNNFINNSAQYEGGAICAYSNTSLSFSGTNNFINNSAKYYGGAITGYSNITLSFNGTNNFINNSANSSWGGGGGAIDVYNNSTLSFIGVSNFERNSAIRGGGIYASRNSVLNISGTSNFSSNSAVRGGAIFSNNNITLTFDGTIHFTSNGHNTGNGGAMFLDDTSTFIILPNTTVYWVNNQATLGGAIYVHRTSITNYYTQMLAKKDCFFRLSKQNLSSSSDQLVFKNNSAVVGSVLYGGEAQNCTLIDVAHIEDDYMTSRVCPDISRICPCENNDQGCSNQPEITHSVYPGETFTVSMVAPSRNRKLPATVRARIQDNPDSNLYGPQYTQQINTSTCSLLDYTMFSQSDFVLLHLYGSGPCSSLFSYTLNISLNQNCPPGFNISEDKSCACGQRLQKYTNSCNISSGNITRDSLEQFWVGYDDDSNELILHPHCPFDYCVNDKVIFPLNNTDVQCAYNRSRLLCGACKEGYSLVLGTSQCEKCTNSHLALIIPFAVMGVALVFLLMVCKLTMATGTLSGLVFYANIVGVNRTIFLPEGSPALSVFIAWLNLDFGIETCFYNGMDAYSQTWLQFVFPAYLWVLVGLVILVSNYSHRFANLLGNNPVPILATLILLSYAKILRTLIAAINFTYLEYPTNNRRVWLYDANIDHLVGEHIPFFIVAVLVFLFLFLPYTLLLVFGQWLQAISHLKLFSWVNRLKPLMDSYHAPYKAKHRYWPGLLLVLRFVLFLAFAIEFTPQQDRTSINLLSILVVAGTLQLWAWVSGGVYRNWCLDALEGSFSLNLIILAAATMYTRYYNVNRLVENQLSQLAVGYTSVSIALVTFIGILVYHIFQQVRHTKLWKKVPKLKLKFNKLNIKQAVNNLDRTEHQCEATPNTTVTQTEISPQELHSSVLDHPERPCDTTSTDINIVTNTETDFCELHSPLDTLDTK